MSCHIKPQTPNQLIFYDLRQTNRQFPFVHLKATNKITVAVGNILGAKTLVEQKTGYFYEQKPITLTN